jgi:hypothetical protein
MNRNTRSARKRKLSNNPEITVGTGERRELRSRRADPIFAGSACDTGFGANASKHTTPHKYPRITKEQRAKEGF